MATSSHHRFVVKDPKAVVKIILATKTTDTRSDTHAQVPPEAPPEEPHDAPHDAPPVLRGCFLHEDNPRDNCRKCEAVAKRRKLGYARVV